MYEQRIKMLEESHRLIDNQLFQLERSGSSDSDTIQKLQEQKNKYLNELRNLRRLQWDIDHERVNFDDDR